MKSVRIFYKKLGRMKFVSHLDMNRFMSRLIRKSKIPVWYTEGFNRHIYMNFAVPLSLGFEGLYEIMDIKLTDDNFSNEECLSALNAVSIPDIEFFAIEEPLLKTKDIAFAKFSLSFENLSKETKEKLKEFLSKDSYICQKVGKKGKLKEIDIMPKIKDYSIEENTLTLTLNAGEDNLNPTLVMTAFFEFSQTPPIFYTVKRLSILDKAGKDFK